MDEQPVRLRPADTEGIEYAIRLLEAAGLPTDDIREKRDWFFDATRDGNRVGVGALEAYGTVGLLRSVAVDPHERGQGVGSGICAALEREARELGVERLYLLTTKAAGFFRSIGYEHIGRDAAPPAIRETTQFAELCPDSAVCLMKALDGDSVQDGS